MKRTTQRWFKTAFVVAATRQLGSSSLVIAVASLMGCATALYPSPASITEEVPNQEILARVVLLGDGGDAGPDAAVLRLAQQDASAVSLTAMVFLGDNVYPAGMPPADDQHRNERKNAERVLREQVEASKGASDALFLPGNHDWDQAPASGDGVTRLKAAAEFLATVQGGATRVRMLPAQGCPGPTALDVGEMIRLVAIDTEWLLASDDAGRKPLNDKTGCLHGPTSDATEYAALTSDSFYEALKAVLLSSGNRLVLIVAHHPLESHGPHGGYGLGFLNIFFDHKEDLSSSEYRRMQKALRNAMRSANYPLLYAAGHEHSLQVLEDSQGFVTLVSGSASKTTAVTVGRNTQFKHSHLGYMLLDVLAKGRLVLTVVEPDDTNGERVIAFRGPIEPKVPK